MTDDEKFLTWLGLTKERLEAMKTLLEFDDAGAADDEPVKGIVMSDIRAWHDRFESETKHYLGAIKLKLARLYEEHPNDPILREQISDEVDWIDTQLSP